MLIFDSFVFGMTLHKSIALSHLNGVKILEILLRDGELYLPGNSSPFEPNEYPRHDLFRVGFGFLSSSIPDEHFTG